MKKLLVYLKDYKKESFFAPLFKMLEAIFELIVPLVVASIIDNGILKNNISYVVICSAILVALAVIGKELRYALFDKIESLSFSEVDSIGTSSLITRLTTDSNQVQNGVNLVLRLFLRSPFIVFGAMIMAFTVDVKCALIFVGVIPVLSLVVFGIMAYTIPKYKRVQNNLDSVTLKTRENLSGARVIRAFTQEEAEINDFTEKNDILTRLQKGVGKISALMNPVTYVIINIAVIALIYSGALQVNKGNLSQGEVVALYNYMSQILVELIKLANLIITITKALACASRIESVMNLENSLQHNRNNELQSENAVDFDNVSLKYKDASENSLENISFIAEKGSVIGIIGGTGSGKTSLVSLIPHFYDATGGKVLVNGMDVKSYSDDDLRQRIGFVFQKAALFKGTVRDNLKWGNEHATDDDMLTALKKAQVLDTVLDKGGLDAAIEQNGSNLSGGQKQRLSVARALVRKPDILILDDSSSALDYATEAAMRKEILNLDYNPTVFIVSQRASSVMNADKIIVLDDGSVCGVGNHNQLLEQCDVYKEIYTSQFGEEDSHE